MIWKNSLINKIRYGYICTCTVYRVIELIFEKNGMSAAKIHKIERASFRPTSASISPNRSSMTTLLPYVAKTFFYHFTP